MCIAQGFDQLSVVGVELEEHFQGVDEILVVIRDALQAGDVADGANGGAAELAHALGDRSVMAKNLRGLLVQQKVIVAEVRPAHVPVEVLGFHVEGEDIGQQCIEHAGQVPHIFRRKAVRRGV